MVAGEEDAEVEVERVEPIVINPSLPFLYFEELMQTTRSALLSPGDVRIQ
jgi:hypothetical protein